MWLTKYTRCERVFDLKDYYSDNKLHLHFWFSFGWRVALIELFNFHMVTGQVAGKLWINHHLKTDHVSYPDRVKGLGEYIISDLYLTDWFKQHITPSWVILCLEISESNPLYIYTYVFRILVP